MKKKNLTPLKNILDSFFKRNHLDSKIKGYQVIYNWKDCVWEKIASHSQPFKIQGNTLFLIVDGHVWANELNINQGEIIKKINDKANEEIIDNIKFKIQTNYFNKKSVK